MSIATIITRGYGSFGSIAGVILHGYGDFGAQVYGGPNDYYDRPPEGYRRVLDTHGIDLRARHDALLYEARREIGLLRDEEPPPVLEEIIEELAEIEARIQAPAEIEAPIAILFDRAAYARTIARTLRAEIVVADVERAEMARFARMDWIRRDDEAVLLLMAGSI